MTGMTFASGISTSFGLKHTQYIKIQRFEMKLIQLFQDNEGWRNIQESAGK